MKRQPETFDERDVADPFDDFPMYRGNSTRGQDVKQVADFVDRYKRGVRDTSKAAYREFKESGQLGRQAQKIYDFLKHKGRPMTRAEIEHDTRIRISSVSGRVKEMLKCGRIKEAPKRKCRITKFIATPVVVG